MADSANANEVRIRVVLDSREAESRLAQIKAAMDALNARIGVVNTGGNGIGLQTYPYANMPSPQNASANVVNGSSKLEKNVSAIAFKQVTDLIVELFKDIVSFVNISKDMAYNNSRTAFEDNYERDYEYKVRHGAMSGAGTWGGVGAGIVGGLGMLFGVPWLGGILGGLVGAGLGTAVGAVLGTAVGAVTTRNEVVNERRLEIERKQLGRYMTAQKTDEAVDVGIGNMSFQRSLKYAGSKDARIAQYEDAMQQLEYGEGASSIRNLTKKMRQLELDSEDGKGKDSPEYAELERRYNAQMSMLAQLRQGKFSEEYLVNQPKPYDGSDFSDAFSKKGWYVGGQVDVNNVNQPIIDNLTSIREVLLQQTDRMLDKMGVSDDIENAHFPNGTVRGNYRSAATYSH